MLKIVIIVALVSIALYCTKVYIGGCTCDSKTRLDGKTIVITGANTGIGLETVKILLNRGGNIIATTRDTSKCQSIVDHVKENINEESLSRLKCVLLDLASRDSIESCTKEILAMTNKIHILINNAGVMGLAKYTQTQQGFEMIFGVNHLGHFLLTHLLTPRLIESQPSRIIIVSSIAHAMFNGLNNFTALNDPDAYRILYSYANSKAANILHAQELHRRFKSKGVTSVSLHPGTIATDLTRNIGSIMPQLSKYAQYVFLKTPWEGAQTTVHCALDESVDENSGAYYCDCRPIQPSYIAESDERGQKLWKFSEEIWGIKS